MTAIPLNVPNVAHLIHRADNDFVFTTDHRKSAKFHKNGYDVDQLIDRAEAEAEHSRVVAEKDAEIAVLKRIIDRVATALEKTKLSRPSLSTGEST